MPPVKMFTLSTCSHCRATKEYFSRHGIAYEYTDVDLLDFPARREILKEIKKLSPQLAFPTILIGDRVIVGFREEAIREALGL
jgi:glutaredoxin